jgi:hypothetical protein
MTAILGSSVSLAKGGFDRPDKGHSMPVSDRCFASFAPPSSAVERGGGVHELQGYIIGPCGKTAFHGAGRSIQSWVVSRSLVWSVVVAHMVRQCIFAPMWPCQRSVVPIGRDHHSYGGHPDGCEHVWISMWRDCPQEVSNMCGSDRSELVQGFIKVVIEDVLVMQIDSHKPHLLVLE